MPDISMCKGEKNKEICPLREQCYRYTATANDKWQSYILPDPFGKDCIHYWPNNGQEGE